MKNRRGMEMGLNAIVMIIIVIIVLVVFSSFFLGGFSSTGETIIDTSTDTGSEAGKIGGSLRDAAGKLGGRDAGSYKCYENSGGSKGWFTSATGSYTTLKWTDECGGTFGCEQFGSNCEITTSGNFRPCVCS